MSARASDYAYQSQLAAYDMKEPAEQPAADDMRRPAEPQPVKDDMPRPAADLDAAYQKQPVAGLGANRDTPSQMYPTHNIPSQIYPTRDTPSKQLEEKEKKGEEAKEEKKREEAKEEKKRKEAKEEKKREEDKEEKKNVNSGLIITGVLVAVIGAIFVVFKNIKKA